MRYLTVSKARPADLKAGNEVKVTVDWWAVAEVCISTFIITMLLRLYEIGSPPTSLTEIYMPFLYSAIMTVWAYVRVRKLEIETEATP